MIKTFKPSKLRGLKPQIAEKQLSKFYGMDVAVAPDFEYIDLAVFDVYEDPDEVLEHARNSLSKVGSYAFCSTREATVLRLTLNARAKEVILNLDAKKPLPQPKKVDNHD